MWKNSLYPLPGIDSHGFAFSHLEFVTLSGLLDLMSLLKGPDAEDLFFSS